MYIYACVYTPNKQDLSRCIVLKGSAQHPVSKTSRNRKVDLIVTVTCSSKCKLVLNHGVCAFILNKIVSKMHRA